MKIVGLFLIEPIEGSKFVQTSYYMNVSGGKNNKAIEIPKEVFLKLVESDAFETTDERTWTSKELLIKS